MKKQKQPKFLASFSSDRLVLGFCIGLALFLWLLVKLSQEFITTRVVNIEYLLPDNRSFVETPPASLVTTVKGTGWNLLSNYLDQEETTIRFNLPEKPSFTINGSILKNKIEQSLGKLNIQDINYDFILLNMDGLDQKRLPIRLVSELDFAAQHQLKEPIQLEPDSVNVSGPPVLLDSLKEWLTTPLKMTDLKNSFTTTLSLVSAEKLELKLNPKRIKVSAEIEQNTQKDLFIPVLVLNGHDSLNIFPQNIRISCIVGLSNYDRLSSSDFVLEADFKNVSQNSTNNTLPVNLSKIPAYVKQVKLDKESVEYFLVKAE